MNAPYYLEIHSNIPPSTTNTATVVVLELSRSRICIRLRNGIPITATVLPIIRRVRRSPTLRIQRAVKTLRYSIIGNDIGVEECLSKRQRTLYIISNGRAYASLIASISSRMSLVICRLRRACGCARRRRIPLALTESVEFVAHICVFALCV